MASLIKTWISASHFRLELFNYFILRLMKNSEKMYIYRYGISKKP